MTPQPSPEIDALLAAEALFGPTDPSYLATNSQAAIENAAALGHVVMFPAPNELQIDLDDIDTSGSEQRYYRSLEILKREFGITADDVTQTPSKSGTGIHVRIKMPFDLTPWQRIALQAAMGSDPVRELLSAVRLHAGDPNPTLFFELPSVAESLTSVTG